ATPLCSTQKFIQYDAVPLLGGTIERYLYFAASVFWRAAACHWHMGANQQLRLSLGKTYQEQFRLYLLGQARFPSNGRIHLCVANEAPSQLLEMAFPSSVPNHTRKTESLQAPRHKFYMLGLIFVLFLGQKAPQLYDNGALNGTQPAILLCSWREDSLF